MDDYAKKKAGHGLVSRKGSSLVLRDTSVNSRDRNAQFCNRIGCSGMRNTNKGSQINCSEKTKLSRPSYRSSSSGKDIIGSSSRPRSTINNLRKPLPEPRKKLFSQIEMGSSETGSVQDEPEVAELVFPTERIQRDCPEESDNTRTNEISMEVGSSSMLTSIRSRMNVYQNSGLSNKDIVAGSSASLTSRSTGLVSSANTSRYGLKNLRCNNKSDVSNTSSSSDSNMSRRKDTVKKRVSDGESSSSTKGKRMSGSPMEWQNASSSSGISLSDFRRARSGPSNRDNIAASVRTRRSLYGYTRTRVPLQGSRNNLSVNDSHVVTPQMSQSDVSADLNAHTSPHQSSLETSSSRLSSYGRSGGNSTESSQVIRPSSPVEVGSTQSLINRDSFRRYNMDGIAEMLFALERIEQDEELTYEQLLVLEGNLFLNGLNFYDQHRDMRLDIDNMSYEELLALEERMGTVSTALTEEALSECLKTSIYETDSEEETTEDFDVAKDDVKCSICQEEYMRGDEVGRLRCEHMYHVVCIQQWLRLKNWCPICKASAAPSSVSP